MPITSDNDLYIDLDTVDRDYWRFQVDTAVRNSGDWFTIKLLQLLFKADLANRERIRLGFPVEVAVFEAWKEGTL